MSLYVGPTPPDILLKKRILGFLSLRNCVAHFLEKICVKGSRREKMLKREW